MPVSEVKVTDTARYQKFVAQKWGGSIVYLGMKEGQAFGRDRRIEFYRFTTPHEDRVIAVWPEGSGFSSTSCLVQAIPQQRDSYLAHALHLVGITSTTLPKTINPIPLREYRR